MKFDVYAYKNKGGRAYNQDSTAFDIKENRAVFVLADGLGGHSFGELASAMVCQVVAEEWEGYFAEGPEVWIKNKLLEANRRVLKVQEEKSTVMKSTAVVLAVEGDQAVWGNVGDSRLYYIHEGNLESYTNDHSVAYKKYKGGEITREEICTDPDQSALLRTIGSEDRCKPELYSMEHALESGDAFVLLSDGAWEYIRDCELAADLVKAANAESWAKLLLLRLMDRIEEGNDNLSIMTVIVK